MEVARRVTGLFPIVLCPSPLVAVLVYAGGDGAHMLSCPHTHTLAGVQFSSKGLSQILLAGSCGLMHVVWQSGIKFINP